MNKNHLDSEDDFDHIDPARHNRSLPDPAQPNPGFVDDATRFASNDAAESEDDFDMDEGPALVNSGLVGVVGEYLLIEQIGAGGMGHVFRAEHRTMNREVALKVLSREIADQPKILEQFFLEIRAAARLMHPNIVTAFDAGSSADMHYLVMELVDGEMLSSKIRRDGPLSTNEAVNVLEQAAKALEYAHRQGIVHRDVKPGNMMLTTTGVLKILDFGLASIGTQVRSENKKRMFMGTPEFMSPEQIENPDNADGRSDLYSLGATLYYLLTGSPMFTGEKMQVAKAQCQEDPKPLFMARADVDLRLDSIFHRLVAKDPNERFDDAGELLANLHDLKLTGTTTRGESLTKGAFRLGKDSPTSVGLSMSTLAKQSEVIGIDLGLLTSSAAYFDPNSGPQIIPQGDGNSQFLRNMIWSSGRSVKIGSDAAALRQVDPDKIFHSVQRWIGQPKIQRAFGGQHVPPEVILASVLRQIINNAAAITDGSANAVVTVPSCYDQMHRRAIKNACRTAGIELIQLLDKPLAAALSWLDVKCRVDATENGAKGSDYKLLVVQLSGTGLDVAVVHASGTTVKMLGSCGHWTLGLQKWQSLLAQFVAKALQEKTGKSIRDDVSAATRLQRTVEITMNQLSRSSKVAMRFDWEGASIEQTVTQDGIIKIAPDLTLAIQQSIAKACQIAKIDLDGIDHVLLAGSMMQMRSLSRVVTAVVPNQVQSTFMDKSDIARGAAIQARHLSQFSASGKELDLCAIGSTPNDIALLADKEGISNRTPRVLIARGTGLPTNHRRTIRPSQSTGSAKSLPKISLIESSSLDASNWVRLGYVDPESAFENRTSSEPLQLQMDIDASGILRSKLVNPATGEQVRLASDADSDLSAQELDGWREWLETVLLCAN